MTALAAVCGDFCPNFYTKVLEGYLFLGNVASLGAEVKAAFASTIGASMVKVVRGVLLTRPGMEEHAGSSSATLQELVRLLPSDLFRTCLARALMVIFDILVSHFHMVRWHEAALEQHAADLEGLQAASAALRNCLGGEGGKGASSSESSSQSAPFSSSSSSRPSSAGDQAQSCASEGATVTGRAMMQLQRGTPSEMKEVETKASDEEEWGEVLRVVHAGLLAGRQLIWEEAARRIGILLNSPAAFEGEHFLQVRTGGARAQIRHLLGAAVVFRFSNAYLLHCRPGHGVDTARTSSGRVLQRHGVHLAARIAAAPGRQLLPCLPSLQSRGA